MATCYECNALSEDGHEQGCPLSKSTKAQGFKIAGAQVQRLATKAFPRKPKEGN